MKVVSRLNPGFDQQSLPLLSRWTFTEEDEEFLIMYFLVILINKKIIKNGGSSLQAICLVHRGLEKNMRKTNHKFKLVLTAYISLL